MDGRATLETWGLEVLRLARKMGLVKLGTVALDGTKIKANASKHKAMSCQRRQAEQQRLEEEIQASARAEAAIRAALALRKMKILTKPPAPSFSRIFCGTDS